MKKLITLTSVSAFALLNLSLPVFAEEAAVKSATDSSKTAAVTAPAKTEAQTAPVAKVAPKREEGKAVAHKKLGSRKNKKNKA